ncbi:class I SAM-dependent methyltransferase [Methylobacterium sp. WL8]|uniref:class I SAM-dependent methyltransferase n=1 Tax=Methylobacterium sp. WL8 TaxID=2603899 RepID=UPI0011CC9DFD|nr:class I SAM-dependent methyltransferase [Methylobacterium sp. WL8]TXN81962.1 class I SAM-dependent methyltransferase [Methylobacterium sp. WL8]
MREGSELNEVMRVMLASIFTKQDNAVIMSANPEHDKSVKDFSLLKQVLKDYDPSEVSSETSPVDAMAGANYMWVGASAAEVIMTAIAASRLTEVNRVLDLPCGHGRILRHLVKMFPDATFDACDLDSDGVDFCVNQFNARPIRSQEDMTKVKFEALYDIIWIGSLFTHTSAEITKSWLSFLAKHLTENGIIVATFHGRIALELQKINPYIDEQKWSKIMDGHHSTGYGFADYSSDNKHGYISGSYGVSVAKPNGLMSILEGIPDVRIFMYQERAWANNHDVVVIGRPAWDDGLR